MTRVRHYTTLALTLVLPNLVRHLRTWALWRPWDTAHVAGSRPMSFTAIHNLSKNIGSPAVARVRNLKNQLSDIGRRWLSLLFVHDRGIFGTLG
jgi:hypothetical protein